MTAEKAVCILRESDVIENQNDRETGEPTEQKIALDMAIKALERSTGHWVHDGSHWKNRFNCSVCNYYLIDEPTKYCPNCGARMIESEV